MEFEMPRTETGRAEVGLLLATGATFGGAGSDFGFRISFGLRSSVFGFFMVHANPYAIYVIGYFHENTRRDMFSQQHVI